MKKLFLFSITLLLLYPLTFALPVQAESAENVTRRRPDRPAQAEIQEIRQDRQEFRSKVAENHAKRLERRFKFYFDRLTNIISRFKQRLDTLNPNDPTVATIETKLANATSKLAEAKIKGEAAVTAFRAVDPASARDLAQSARALFKEAHALLKDALKSLKLINKPALPASEEAL